MSTTTTLPMLAPEIIDLRVRPAMPMLSKPSIDIALNNPQPGVSTPSFSTFDKIEGEVRITAKNDTRFDQINITFEGIAYTFVDSITTGVSRMEKAKRFLMLRQPIDYSTQVPQPRVLLAGQTVTIPFTFVVPQKLPLSSCTHSVAHDHVKLAHLQVPPSLGDTEATGFGGKLLDDFAPEMARIRYGVRARLSRDRDSDGSNATLAQKEKKIIIKPAVDEAPPISTDHNPDYILRCEKGLRKFSKGKLGRLIIEAEQPRSFRFPTSPAEDDRPVTTKARAILRFDPVTPTELPPRLGSLSALLRVHTFFAASSRVDFPGKSKIGYDTTQGHFDRGFNIFNHCMGDTQWERHDAPSSGPDLDPVDAAGHPPRRPSFSALPIPAPPKGKPPTPGCPFYTTELLIPLTLPAARYFPPTFHSCLISRIYTLSLDLTLHGVSMMNPKLHLRLPVQISDAGSRDTLEARQRSEEEEAARWDDAVMAALGGQWEPRRVTPPADGQLPDQRREGLPGYETRMGVPYRAEPEGQGLVSAFG